MTRARILRDLEQLRAPAGLSSDRRLDTVGLYCPVPIMKTADAMGGLAPGQIIEVLSDDRVILVDMPAWCLSTGHAYLGFIQEGSEWRLFVRKK